MSGSISTIYSKIVGFHFCEYFLFYTRISFPFKSFELLSSRHGIRLIQIRLIKIFSSTQIKQLATGKMIKWKFLISNVKNIHPSKLWLIFNTFVAAWWSITEHTSVFQTNASNWQRQPDKRDFSTTLIFIKYLPKFIFLQQLRWSTSKLESLVSNWSNP